MERNISIRNYRTIGIDNFEKIIINTSLDKDNLGELVIIVGPNNSGKSNVISAFEALATNITKEDKPDFIFNDSKISPEVKLVVKNNDEIYEYISDYNGKRVILNKKEIEDDIDKKNLEEFYSLFGFSLAPQLHIYQEKEIKHSQFHADISSIDNEFFLNIFNSIEVDKKDISSLYDKYLANSSNAGILRQYETIINKKLKVISKEFNRLYKTDKDDYEFKIVLESSKIYFTLFLGENALTLDKQSTGFKWFFNFYFNLIAGRKLKAGDIILMDEPATNLHVQGIVELRNFIKQFAKNTGVSFVIATHSPFFIDCDYLEEVRVVSKINSISTIKNKFTLIEESQTDTLNSILNALTVGRNIVLNPGIPMFFVEGITDYNYLIAFKKYFKINDICFMPINGLKRPDLLGSLRKISKVPLLLVDGDGIGEKTVKIFKDKGIEVRSVSEVDSSFKNIEDLFEETDRSKYAKEKSYDLSLSFKSNIDSISKTLSQTTIDNFRKLFDLLMV